MKEQNMVTATKRRKTGATERAGRAEGTDAEPCRIRHARSGLYLEVNVRIMPESHRDIMLRWRLGMAAGTAMPRGMAARMAAVYIALTGDHGVELEPAEKESEL